jgi:hypothetical protein
MIMIHKSGGIWQESAVGYVMYSPGIYLGIATWEIHET